MRLNFVAGAETGLATAAVIGANPAPIADRTKKGHPVVPLSDHSYRQQFTASLDAWCIQRQAFLFGS
jgi:hypothetical protein